MLDGTEIIHLERAELLIDVVRWREAIHELHKYLTYFPDDYHALCQISRCHYELSEYADAMKFANRAIESEPEREWAFRLQSLIFRETAENDKALESAEKCVQKAPHQEYALQTLAYAQIRKFKLDEAEKTIDVMLEISPESSETHDVCGYLALKREQWEKAEKHYLNALKIDAQSANSLNNLGVVYLNKMDTHRKRADKTELRTKAAECFERAIKINPNYQLAHDNLQIAKTKSTISNSTILFWILFGILINGFLRAGYELFSLFAQYLSPFNDNFVIFGLNLFFIFSIVSVLGLKIYSFFKDKSLFDKLFSNFSILLTLFFSQIISLTFYLTISLLFDSKFNFFSFSAVTGFVVGTLFFLGKLIIYKQTKYLSDE